MKKFTAFILCLLLSFSVFSAFPMPEGIKAVAEETVETITVSPGFDQIENYKGKTWFIVMFKSAQNSDKSNADLVWDLQNNHHTLKVKITDETQNKNYSIDKYLFKTPNLEYGTGLSGGDYFLRLAACEYGIIPVQGHRYTITLEFLNASGKTVAKGTSAKGAFAKCNADFAANGPIIPEDLIPDPEPVRLDVNKDGIFNIRDLTSLLIHLENSYLDFTPDFDFSGAADIGDATTLLQFLRTEEPFDGIIEEIVGNVRLQLLSASVLRVEEKSANGFCDAETMAVTNRTDWEGVKATRYMGGGRLLLVTDLYTVSSPLDAEKAKEVFVTDSDGSVLWKYQADASAVTYLPEPADTPESWCFNDTPRIVPSELQVTLPENKSDYVENNGWIEESNVSDFYVFLPQKNTVTLRRDFVSLTGRCDLVPLKTLGLWFSRWHAYSDNEVIALVNEFRERGYPIDMFVVDTDWRSSTDGTGYTVNKKYFPDIEAFFKRASENKVGILFNDHVHSSKLSLLSYEQLQWFINGVTEKLKNGLSAWWYDRNWTHTLISPFSNIHGDLLGQHLYLTLTKNYRASVGSDARGFLLSNIYWNYHGSISSAPYVATHRYSIQWTGDIASTYTSLRRELENLVFTGAVSAIGYYSSDIGGNTGNPEEDLFIRWTQYGALSPIMRYHSTSSANRSPWTVGSKADQVAKAYINMRYRLMPLFYTLSYENYALGLPLARRLDFYYPQYEDSRRNDQYLLGEDILVAPFCDGNAAVPAAWFRKNDGEKGIKATFYNNTNMSGNAAATTMVDNIDFDWGTGIPMKGVNADNFSAVFEGEITAPDFDIRLGTLSDDGVKLYIDEQLDINNWQASNSVTVMGTKVLEANKTYKIRLEYYDGLYDAKIKLVYEPANTDEPMNTRTVFIPDGSWMNLFTGETVVGPQTIEVTMPVTQSPLFVKTGSTTVLTTPGESASESDWENITLDIYGGKNTEDITLHYEDDGTTEGYKDGNYRLTKYTTVFDQKGAMTLTAEVTKEGEAPTSFEERQITLRIHADSLQSVSVNGKKLSVTALQKDASAAPFAVESGSPDGRVYTVSFRCSASEGFTVSAN